MAAGAVVGAWMLVLSLWGEPLPCHNPPRPVPKSPPQLCRNLGAAFQSPSSSLF